MNVMNVMNAMNTDSGMTGSYTIRTEHRDIPVGAGAAMGAYVARPSAPGPFPGVLVGMELFGVDAGVRAVCDRLAALGFVALAPDFHHRTAPGSELPRDHAGRARGFELLELMTRAQLLSDVGAAVDHLRADGSERVSMVGLSVGGHMAYLAATEFDLAAVAVFYGGWLPTTDIPISRPEPTLSLTPKITGRVLFLVGEEDHLIPPARQREIADALREAGTRHEMVVYPGVGHGFLGTDRTTSADAWRRVHALLTGTAAAGQPPGVACPPRATQRPPCGVGRPGLHPPAPPAPAAQNRNTGPVAASRAHGPE